MGSALGLGFTTDDPSRRVTVGVSWLKNADGTPREFTVDNFQAIDAGLIADLNGTHWFLPWSSVVFLKQVNPTPPA